MHHADLGNCQNYQFENSAWRRRIPKICGGSCWARTTAGKAACGSWPSGFGVRVPWAWKISRQRKRTRQMERIKQRHRPRSRITAEVQGKLGRLVKQQPRRDAGRAATTTVSEGAPADQPSASHRRDGGDGVEKMRLRCCPASGRVSVCECRGWSSAGASRQAIHKVEEADPRATSKLPHCRQRIVLPLDFPSIEPTVNGSFARMPRFVRASGPWFPVRCGRPRAGLVRKTRRTAKT